MLDWARRIGRTRIASNVRSRGNGQGFILVGKRGARSQQTGDESVVRFPTQNPKRSQLKTLNILTSGASPVEMGRRRSLQIPGVRYHDSGRPSLSLARRETVPCASRVSSTPRLRHGATVLSRGPTAQHYNGNVFKAPLAQFDDLLKNTAHWLPWTHGAHGDRAP